MNILIVNILFKSDLFIRLVFVIIVLGMVWDFRYIKRIIYVGLFSLFEGIY